MIDLGWNGDWLNHMELAFVVMGCSHGRRYVHNTRMNGMKVERRVTMLQQTKADEARHVMAPERNDVFKGVHVPREMT
jgi:hypothetical protein